jgi:hypothetical protein
MLPLETVFTSLTVDEMEDVDVRRIASEPPYVQASRQQLRAELASLSEGLRACNGYSIGASCK